MIHKTTRSILSVLLAALLLVTSIPLTPAFADGGAVSLQSESAEGRALEQDGDGTAGNPYKIATAADLLEFADKVNNKNQTSAWAELTADIDLSEICSEEGGVSWTPIGTNSNEYTGTFNGDGHTISGLTINSSSDKYQGLFGYVGTGGTVKDLTVSGSVKGDDYVGGVVGYNRGSVENCHNIGSVSGNNYVGGVVGDNRGTVKNCYNTGNISDPISGNRVGGVVGYNNGGTVENCYNTGKVSGPDSGNISGYSYVGGVVGQNFGGNVKNCYNTGKVSGPDSGSGNSVGGVVGDNGGNVKGWNRGTVENCYNTGSVSGNSVGGVVGYNYSGGSVTNSYNTGEVSGGEDVGGVVGYNHSGGSVTGCYNTGAVNSSGNQVGGVVGHNISSGGSGTVTGCYFLTGTAEKGIGDEADATGAAAVDNLDELCKALESDTTTWTISENLSRPVLTSNHEDDGSKDHPYEIFTATQLKNFRDLVNDENGNPAAWAVLMENIDLSEICGESAGNWNPIGNSEENAYTGTFNGDGHTISGLYIAGDDDDQGLFGRVNGGTVKDLTVSGSVSGSNSVGGVVGYNDRGTVTGCIFSGSGSVSGPDSVSGNNYVGGVVGDNSGSVEKCHNTGSVNGSVNSVGGVVGENSGSGSVENCYNTGSVNGSIEAGGVVGLNSGGNVENCYNIGEVSGMYVGGVVGQNFGGNVENCYNTGKVSGTYVGGVVGMNNSGDSSASASVTNCYNTGKVSGNRYVGGVVGWNSSGTVKNCYNTGSVSGPYSGNSNQVGGVVGRNDEGHVTNCYNIGAVSGSNRVGGVVGMNDGSVTNCYFLSSTADANENLSGIGEGSGTASDVEPKTAKDFHSGEVAWLLENGQAAGSSQVWGQSNLTEEDSWPTLIALDKNAKTVYKVITVFGYDEQPDNVSYTNNPATPSETPSREGYTFGGWDKTGEGTTTITYTAKWTAEEPPYTGKYSYELSTSVGDHGSLTVDRYATEGEKVTITVTPDQAYKLDDLSVTAGGKEVTLTAGGDGTYTFTMPSADVKITATFAEDPDWTEPEEPATDVSDLFSDIAPDAWYKDAVQYAYDNGLMTGVSDTEFAPEATTTRAMIVSILARLENVTTAEAAGFADVDDNDWYATAVNWAANVGVVNGYEDNTFKPNTAITREQLAAILMNYAAYKGYDVSARADLSHYSDADSISSWANDVLLWAVAEGLLTGVTDDTIAPQAHATRAQVAAILQRFLSE